MNHSEQIKQTVKDKYNQLAKTKQSCCGTADCGFVGESYTSLDGYLADADLGLGCGLPTKFAGIEPGDTVVDLGSGAGNDCFIALRETGRDGRVIGIDMAESMLERARENAAMIGATNVEFRLGEIESIPVGDNSVDVVVSNCVLNLVPDKAKAYAETFRILKPGAHFSISDVVISGDLPAALRQAAELYVGCVAGAMKEEEYLLTIKAAGFEEVKIQQRREITLSDDLLDQYLDPRTKSIFQHANVGIYSITVFGRKPAESSCYSGSPIVFNRRSQRKRRTIQFRFLRVLLFDQSF